jgi:membrane-associated phospholipid phosphatase
VKNLFKNNAAFYLPYTVFVIVGAILILKTEQFDLHTKFNSIVGNSFLDFFFKYGTHIGDGLFLILIAIVLFFFNFKNGIFLLVSYALAGGFTQFLKKVFFNFEMRPFFHHTFNGLPLKVVEGVKMYSQNSFPSGHSTSAFCLFFCLSIISPKIWQKILFFCLAIIIGFSRVYLSQHFFEDVYVGSIIGVVFSSIAAYIFFYSKFSVKLTKLEQPINKVFKKQNG